ncbi:hypothetical protein [Chryseobacterium vrystaatense]|uniref:Uncharacterized protein n=1 Tax=Chryseobacterium vrystaatense TaxID=307480 RepID=A0A1M4ZGA7_9FLAO|nr:hypothetical protein [Chryseobacterium vrystaatense]SHF17005.1 hypothetical protein SAMN02787073_1588 [Chryseobacterium vrystaatense]
MDLNNGFFLAKDNEGYLVYRGKKVVRLSSKDFKEAVIEAKLITKNETQNVK